MEESCRCFGEPESTPPAGGLESAHDFAGRFIASIASRLTALAIDFSVAPSTLSPVVSTITPFFRITVYSEWLPSLRYSSWIVRPLSL
jgi:hypothetical protein